MQIIAIVVKSCIQVCSRFPITPPSRRLKFNLRSYFICSAHCFCNVRIRINSASAPYCVHFVIQVTLVQLMKQYVTPARSESIIIYIYIYVAPNVSRENMSQMSTSLYTMSNPKSTTTATIQIEGKDVCFKLDSNCCWRKGIAFLRFQKNCKLQQKRLCWLESSKSQNNGIRYFLL